MCMEAKSVSYGLDRRSSVTILDSTIVCEITKENDWSLIGRSLVEKSPMSVGRSIAGSWGLWGLFAFPIPHNLAANGIQLCNATFVCMESQSGKRPSLGGDL